MRSFMSLISAKILDRIEITSIIDPNNFKINKNYECSEAWISCVAVDARVQGQLEVVRDRKFYDAETQIFTNAFKKCFSTDNHERRKSITSDIINFLNSVEQYYTYPCLSVRTALDAFFRVKKFPEGSEVILSAISIPDLPKLIQEHGLRCIPLDVDYETLTPESSNLEKLVTKNTVAVIIAHLYGKQIDISALMDVARRFKLFFIEDIAESFFDIKSMGNPSSDLILFSFGLIKNYTAFGGAIFKVSDKETYSQMVACLSAYPNQAQSQYLKKLMKYFFIYLLLDVPSVVYLGLRLSKAVNIDHKKYVVSRMRGFPDNLIVNIRHQPCSALLEMLLYRLKNINGTLAKESKMKGDFAIRNLPAGVKPVGTKAASVNYWLFPILVEQPDCVIKIVNSLGIDAFRGATQLTIIEPIPLLNSLKKHDAQNNEKIGHSESLSELCYPEKPKSSSASIAQDNSGQTVIYPHKAKYLIDHVIYLPINKFTPYESILYICWGLGQAVSQLGINKPKSKL